MGLTGTAVERPAATLRRMRGRNVYQRQQGQKQSYQAAYPFLIGLQAVDIIT